MVLAAVKRSEVRARQKALADVAEAEEVKGKNATFASRPPGAAVRTRAMSVGHGTQGRAAETSQAEHALRLAAAAHTLSSFGAAEAEEVKSYGNAA
jgi:hypothetical protein